MNQTEIIYSLALMQIPGIGPLLARKLMERLGSAEAVLRTSPARLETTPGIGPALTAAIRKANTLALAEAEWERCQKYKISLLHFRDEQYPARLRQCPDAPLLLFAKGDMELNANRVVAVVGTRSATDYGRMLTEQLVQGLAALNVLVLSGLAYGIDIHAHRSAIKNQMQTVAVLGHGLGTLYPAAHRSTAEQMEARGGLLTECWYHTGPDKENFPKRNRIVAGMSDAVVVVEAAENGGALITAALANDYNRDVFAFPGKVHDKYSTGCHKLIKQNKAALITNADDLCTAMGWVKSTNVVQTGFQTLLFQELENDEQLIFELIKTHGQQGIDSLCIRSGFSLTQLSNVLLGLEFKGLVRSLPGKQFVLL
jgi:DNA processing protein